MFFLQSCTTIVFRLDLACWSMPLNQSTSKHQRVTWPGLYRKLIAFLGIVVWHMRVSTPLLEVTWLECVVKHDKRLFLRNATHNGFNHLALFMWKIFLHQVCLQPMPCGHTEPNVNDQTLTQVSQLYVHISFCLKVMTKSVHWWSWSCDLHGWLITFNLVNYFIKLLTG